MQDGDSTTGPRNSSQSLADETRRAYEEMARRSSPPKVGDVIKVEEIDRVIGRTRFVGLIVHLYDPEAVRRAQDYIAQCIANRLPQILAEARKKAAALEAGEGHT